MSNTRSGLVSGERAAFILVTDIHRSTKLWDSYRTQFKEILERHNHEVESTVSEFGGEIMKNLGDGYIAIFGTADSCIGCGVEAQKRFSKMPALPDGSRFKVRVVAHGGALMPLATGKGYFGQPLNRASRICQVCHPGQMLVSEAAKSFVGTPPSSSSFIDLGTHRLRDLSEPEHLYQVLHPEFIFQDFGPLPTLAGFRPNNLVKQPNSFIGREPEMAELTALIANGEHRLITITGAGGYGKSRLAMQLCADVLDYFDDGVFAVHLASLNEAGRVATATADALKFPLQGVAEPAEQLLAFLGDKRMLIYYDNFEHLLGARNFVSGLLKYAPGVTILTTSREPLRLSSEQIFQIEPLPVIKSADDANGIPDAVELFIDRASLVKRDLLAAENSILHVQSICEKLEGAPLAIELAAAWADSFTLPELAGELSGQLELTARMSDIEPRHKSIRASLDWSYGLLLPEQQELLKQVSVFRGGFFVESAKAISGVEPMRQRLAELRDKSWLSVAEAEGRTRFMVRDAAAREYALLKLLESGDMRKNVTAHAMHFAKLTAEYGVKLHTHDQLEASAVFELELNNILEAAENAVSGNHELKVEELCECLMSFANYLLEFLNIKSKWSDGAYWAGRIFEAGEAIRSANVCACAIARQGIFYLLIGNHYAARELMDRAAKLRNEATGLPCLAEIERFFGFEAFISGRLDEAAAFYEQSLVISKEGGSPVSIANSLVNIGNIAQTSGKIPEAEQSYLAAEKILFEIGDGRGVAGCRFNLANIAMRRGNLEDAKNLFHESLKIFTELGEIRLVAGCNLNLGIIAMMQNRLDDAEELINNAIGVRGEIGDNVGYALCLLNLGIVAILKEELPKAANYIFDSIDTFRNAGYLTLLIEAIAATAYLLLKSGNARKAIEVKRDADAVAGKTGIRIQGVLGKLAEELQSEFSVEEIEIASGSALGIEADVNLGELTEKALAELAMMGSVVAAQ